MLRRNTNAAELALFDGRSTSDSPLGLAPANLRKFARGELTENFNDDSRCKEAM